MDIEIGPPHRADTETYGASVPEGLKHECAVFLAYQRPSPQGGEGGVLPTVLAGLKAQSNRGQEGYGLASLKEGQEAVFRIKRSGRSITEVGHMTLEEEVELFANFDSKAIIGHNRYATHGLPDESNSQPMLRRGRAGGPTRAIAFNGHIANAATLRLELEALDYTFLGTTDTEVLLALLTDIADRNAVGGGVSDYEAIFSELDLRIDGACSLVLLDDAGQAVVYRNSSGIRPLEFFESTDGLLLAASETEAFSGLDGQVRTINAGEILHYDARRDRWTVARVAPAKLRYCLLEPLYFSRANSIYRGHSHYRVRRDIGVAMAEQERDRISQLSTYERARTRVMPVPNTAIPYAIGLSNALDLPYEMGIERREATRAFINSGRDTRLEILSRKFAVLDEAVAGNNIIMVDDTLVRRETSHTITALLKAAGAARVEWLICAPPFQGTCYYGIAVPSVEELAYWTAFRKLTPDARDRALRVGATPEIEKAIALDIGADSIRFLSFDRMVDAMPGPNGAYCGGCFRKDYPTQTGATMFEETLGRFLGNLSPSEILEF